MAGRLQSPCASIITAPPRGARQPPSALSPHRRPEDSSKLSPRREEGAYFERQVFAVPARSSCSILNISILRVPASCYNNLMSIPRPTTAELLTRYEPDLNSGCWRPHPAWDGRAPQVRHARLCEPGSSRTRNPVRQHARYGEAGPSPRLGRRARATEQAALRRRRGGDPRRFRLSRRGRPAIPNLAYPRLADTKGDGARCLGGTAALNGYVGVSQIHDSSPHRCGLAFRVALSGDVGHVRAPRSPVDGRGDQLLEEPAVSGGNSVEDFIHP
jgi:hypothetical protein